MCRLISLLTRVPVFFIFNLFIHLCIHICFVLFVFFHLFILTCLSGALVFHGLVRDSRHCLQLLARSIPPWYTSLEVWLATLLAITNLFILFPPSYWPQMVACLFWSSSVSFLIPRPPLTSPSMVIFPSCACRPRYVSVMHGASGIVVSFVVLPLLLKCLLNRRVLMMVHHGEMRRPLELQAFRPSFPAFPQPWNHQVFVCLFFVFVYIFSFPALMTLFFFRLLI